MANTSTHDTDFDDLSKGVIRTLSTLDVKALSYVQLRKLSAALNHASDDVSKEVANRAENDNSGDTVRVSSPRFAPPR